MRVELIAKSLIALILFREIKVKIGVDVVCSGDVESWSFCGVISESEVGLKCAFSYSVARS